MGEGRWGGKKGFEQIFVSSFVLRRPPDTTHDEGAIGQILGLIRPEGVSQALARDRYSAGCAYGPHSARDGDPGP